MTVVGVDVSSRAIHLAWLENGKPCRWHQELAKGHLIDRLRSIQVQWPRVGGVEWLPGENLGRDRGPVQDVTDVAIEKPFSQSRRSTAALGAVVGIVTRQAPPWSRVAWPSSGELRAAIGAKNTKQDAHRVIGTGNADWFTTLLDWDEHELDALVACIGWSRILAAQDAQ